MIRVPRHICSDFAAGSKREWLVTNGLGGFAYGTISGAQTRRYHGLLVAALEPPVRRVVLLSSLEEWLHAPGSEPAALSTQEYWDGTVYPEGYRQMEQAALDGMLPVFRFRLGDRVIERRVWMEQGSNRTVVGYRLLRGEPAVLRVRPLLAHRDMFHQRRGEAPYDLQELEDGWRIELGGLTSFVQVVPAAGLNTDPQWYWRFLHRVERDNGVDHEEDLFSPGYLRLPLTARIMVGLVAGTEPVGAGWSAGLSLRASRARQTQVLRTAGISAFAASQMRGQLTLAAGQFLVRRQPPSASDGQEQRSVIAGYPWFTDWGRDTMISLSGLCLSTGRFPDARRVLESFFRFVQDGLIPNHFRDGDGVPEYNSMDATLWMFQALESYGRSSGDWDFVIGHLAQIDDIIRHHVEGTRFNIHVDPDDGLLAGGEEGVQLTWMDAKVDSWVVTPRRGKPVEINALWHNALRLAVTWHERAGRPNEELERLAERSRQSALKKFWYEEGQYLYDLVDGPEGNDPSVRPNQVLALSLYHPLFDGGHAGHVLDVVTRELLTPYGLRTLSPRDPRYRRAYAGNQTDRDAAYHMGTAWPWLIGPYLDAHYRIHKDLRAVRRMLRPFRETLAEAGLGTISEIYEPEPPYKPVGCVAQAWSVAEVLRHLARGERSKAPV